MIGRDGPPGRPSHSARRARLRLGRAPPWRAVAPTKQTANCAFPIYEMACTKVIIGILRQAKFEAWKCQTKFSHYSGVVAESADRESPRFCHAQDRRGQRPRLQRYRAQSTLISLQLGSAEDYLRRRRFNVGSTSSPSRALSLARRSSWPSRDNGSGGTTCKSPSLDSSVHGSGPISAALPAFATASTWRSCLTPNFGVASRARLSR